jgi:TonB family protein
MSGASLRPNAAGSASVTPIYFHKDTVATPSVTPRTPEPALSASHLVPEPPSGAKPDPEQEANTQGETADGTSGKEDGQVLAPFPTWSMNPLPTGFSVFGHQIKTALPVFTPDPPILHGDVPELDRGKDVVMDVVISDQGSIVQVEVLQAVGHGVEISIVETLRRWIFVPAKVNGMAVASHRQLRFHFPS